MPSISAAKHTQILAKKLKDDACTQILANRMKDEAYTALAKAIAAKF